MTNIWKRLFWILVALIIVGVIAFAIAIDIFDQSGVHFLGSYAHVQTRGDCYFLDSTKESVTGKSQFHIDAYVFDTTAGGMYLDAYPVEADLNANWFRGIKYNSKVKIIP